MASDMDKVLNELKSLGKRFDSADKDLHEIKDKLRKIKKLKNKNYGEN